MTLLGGDKDHPGEAPNGITLSLVEKYLYVTAGFRKALRYDVQPDDTVANPMTFIDAGNDGIKCDRAGNVYSVVQGNELGSPRPKVSSLEHYNCR